MSRIIIENNQISYVDDPDDPEYIKDDIKVILSIYNEENSDLFKEIQSRLRFRTSLPIQHYQSILPPITWKERTIH